MATFASHGKYLVQQQIAADKVQIIYKKLSELEFCIWESYETEDKDNRWEVQVVIGGYIYVLRKLSTRKDAESWYTNALRALRLGSAYLVIGETVKVVEFKDLT